MIRFSITTLGCKVNQYDSCALAAAFSRAGMELATDGASPELVVINTCCITATAMRKSRQAIRRAVRGAPAAAILVTGCYSDYDASRISETLASLNVPSDRAVIAGHHDDLAARARQLAVSLGASRHARGKTPPRKDARAKLRSNDVSMNARLRAAGPESIKARRLAAVEGNSPGTRGLGPIEQFEAHSRAFVKVQDGCDAFCAYCIVPYTRPCPWSRSIAQIEQECRALVAAGHKEIVLCGVFLGAFGRNTAVRRRWNGEASKLPELLRRTAGIPGLWRVRLSSLEPADLTDELLAACRELPNVAPHFHLPLQSGSGRILRRMNRQYTPEQYRRTIDRVGSALERPAITTDIIVGFPGETEADFAETLKMARYAGFSKIHIFPFSPIEGTAAWTYRTEAPPQRVAKQRRAELAALEQELTGAYRRRFIGETLEGLVESSRSNRAGLHKAMTDRYLTVSFHDSPSRSSGDLAGQIVNLRIRRETAEGLEGELTGISPQPAATSR